MTPRGMMTVTAVLLCFTLLSSAPAALGSQVGRECCTRYTRKPVPFERIKGYREQTTMENCRIEAIIFYTVKKTQICASLKDAWPRKVLELLSSKLKKMSKANSAAGGTKMSSTTEVFPNATESFY